jgi:hypothetical protein
MKHIRTFENYKISKKREEIIKEAVLQVNDIYKVRVMVDISQSLINAYIKRVKDNTGKNLRQFFSDVDIADEIVKFINTNFLDVENVPADLLMGGGSPDTSSEAPVEPTVQPEVETPVEPTEPAEAPVEAPVEAPEEPTEAPVELPSDEVSDFEEVSSELEDDELEDDDFDLEEDEEDLEEDEDLLL